MFDAEGSGVRERGAAQRGLTCERTGFDAYGVALVSSIVVQHGCYVT